MKRKITLEGILTSGVNIARFLYVSKPYLYRMLAEYAGDNQTTLLKRCNKFSYDLEYDKSKNTFHFKKQADA